MPKKHRTLLFALFAFLLAVVFANQAAAQKEARWEGRVVRSSKDDSTLTVRNSSMNNVEKTIKYDSSTKWVSQYHASKKVNDIDPSQVKDGDYVICKGTEPKAGEFHATVISKRLSHSPE